ncbi:MAG: preprotein translocase subunit YajC [Alphaproteobacteria bacterium]
MLISTAFAQTAATASNPAMAQAMAWLPLVLVFAVFYFLVLRPQNKRAQEHAEMLKAIKRGDKIITAGGFHATVHKVHDDATIDVQLAEGTVATLEKTSVAKVVVRAEGKKKD